MTMLYKFNQFIHMTSLNNDMSNLWIAVNVTSHSCQMVVYQYSTKYI